MASSYTWSNAIDVIKPFVKSIPTSTIDVTICDQVNSEIWLRFPWRWAQASLTSASGVLTLSNGIQDYSIGTTTGGGYYKLLRARITRTDQTPVYTNEFSTIANWLPPNLNMLVDPMGIDGIAFEPVTGGFRLAQAASISGSATFRLDGEYQFQPIKITSTATTIVFPDQYIEVVHAGLLWKYYKLGDDPRADTQMAVFKMALKDMADAEDFSGEDARYPDGGIGVNWGW